MDHKLKILAKIAEVLNKEKIIWAVGGSLLLYIKGITDTFNDLDLMVSEEDAVKVRQLLSRMGQLQMSMTNEKYKTKYFFEWIIEEVEVDVMAGFTILKEEKIHYYPLQQDHIVEIVKICEQSIPLQSVEAWKHYYELMDRTHKVKIIQYYLESKV